MGNVKRDECALSALHEQMLLLWQLDRRGTFDNASARRGVHGVDGLVAGGGCAGEFFMLDVQQNGLGAVRRRAMWLGRM